MKKRLLTLGIGLLFYSLLVSAAFAEEEMNFTDITDNKQHYAAIADLYEMGIIEGYDDGTFRPDNTINRVETLKIVMEYFGWMDEDMSDEELPFSDIDEESWYIDYAKNAYNLGFISGYDNGTFLPDKDVNLAETLKIVSLAAEFDFIERVTLEIDPAPDVPADTWYAGYAQHALDEGAVYLNAEGNLVADQLVTRGQLADILYRFSNDDYFSGEVYYGNATYYADKFEGNGTASGETFQQALYTAAHPTLPFGTYLRVTHQDTGDTTTVRVNDRGPYSDHAIIDLTSTAFDAIGHLGSGIIPVEIEIIYPEE